MYLTDPFGSRVDVGIVHIDLAIATVEITREPTALSLNPSRQTSAATAAVSRDEYTLRLSIKHGSIYRQERMPSQCPRRSASVDIYET